MIDIAGKLMGIVDDVTQPLQVVTGIIFPHKHISTIIVSTCKECRGQCDLFSLRPLPPQRIRNLWYDVQIHMYIHTYIHTDTTCIQHINVGLAQARPNNPLTPPPICLVIIYRTVNAHSNSYTNQKAGLLTKQNFGGEWSVVGHGLGVQRDRSL